MAAIWPASLPQAALLPDRETLPDTVLKTEMEAGLPKRRNRYTAGMRRFNIPLIFTEVQANVFDDFFCLTLKNGALPFEWKWPRRGSTIEYQFLKPPELECFAMDSVAFLYRTTLELEVLASGAAPSPGTIFPFSESVTPGDLSKTITHNMGTAIHKIFATANWLTAVAWSNKTTTTTVLNFNIQAPSGAIVEGHVEL